LAASTAAIPAGRIRPASVRRATCSTSLVTPLAGLSTEEVDNLAAVLDKMLTAMTLARAEERSARSNDRAQPWLCRLCDFAACGRSEGNCPVDNAITSSDRS